MYTKDWFLQHIPTWRKHLSGMAGAPVHALEIGSYEGRSAIWLLENALTHPASTITCVDCFTAPDNGKTFTSNIGNSGFSSKVKTLKGASGDVLKKVEGSFGIIYIDGGHTYSEAMTDLVLCWPMLNDGGILVFDDYKHPKYTCGKAMDDFMRGWSGCYTVLEKGSQVLLKKTRDPNTSIR